MLDNISMWIFQTYYKCTLFHLLQELKILSYTDFNFLKMSQCLFLKIK